VDDDKNRIKKTLYNKSKLIERKDVGNISADQLVYLNQLQGYIKEDAGETKSNENWQPVSFINGMIIYALNP
jgi:hypothetical protein